MPEEVHVGFGQRMLAQPPRNLFDHNSALRALDAPHEIDEEDEKPPDSNELKQPRPVRLILPWGRT